MIFGPYGTFEERSVRNAEIIRLAKCGMTVREIADSLSVHKAKVYRVLASSGVEAVRRNTRRHPKGSGMTHIVNLLRSCSIPCGTEERMQSAIESILAESGLEFDREFVISPRDRIDFKVGSVGIECKVDGSAAKVLSQLLRYAEDSRISELILVTSRHTHRFTVSSLGGKPFRVVRVVNV